MPAPPPAPSERQWIMPMRLPTQRPTSAIEELFPSRELSDGSSQLRATFSWDHLLPAGVAERSVAALQALVNCNYRLYWRRGALCRLSSAALLRDCNLLLELSELSNGGVRLSVDARGARRECWQVLCALCPRLSSLLGEAFPGLQIHSVLSCPGCFARGEWASPTVWALIPLLQQANLSRPARPFCSACGGDVSLEHLAAAE